MRIEADLVRQLAELLNQNDLTAIEVEDGDRKIVVRRSVVVAAAAPVAAAARGTIAGFGPLSYILALDAAVRL